MGGLVKSVFTQVDILLYDALGPAATERSHVHHAAAAHDGLQGDDLIQRHTEHLVLVELAAGLVEGLVGTQVVVTKRKPLTADRQDRGGRVKV